MQDSGFAPLVRAFARVFSNGGNARAFLLRADFPREHIPGVYDPLVFWTQVVEQAQNGMCCGGVKRLAALAAADYPHNETFAGYATKPSVIPSQQDRPIATIKLQTDDSANAMARGEAKAQQHEAEIWDLTLKLKSISQDGVEEILTVLRRVSGEQRIKLRRVRKGSIVLELDVPGMAAKRLLQLFESGRLSELVGHEVIGLEPSASLSKGLLVDFGAPHEVKVSGSVLRVIEKSATIGRVRSERRYNQRQAEERQKSVGMWREGVLGTDIQVGGDSSSSHVPEERLLEHVLRGDRKAIGTFVDTYWSVVESAVSHALSRGPSSAANATWKKDLVQGVWIWLLEREFAPLRSFDPARADLRSFLFLKASSRVRSLYHKKYGLEQSRLGGEHRLDDMEPESDALMTQVRMQELLTMLRSRLSRLELLAFLEMKILGRTAKEFAECHDTNENAARAASRRATRLVHKIRMLMNNDDDDGSGR